MMVIYIILSLLAARPLSNYGSASYIALKARDYSKLKANLLFLGITLVVVIGLIMVMITM